MKVLLVGDTHGNIELVNIAIEKAIKHKCSKIIQVGDFGFFPNLYPKFINELKSSIPFYFIDGNHDDHFNLNHDSDKILSLEELGYPTQNFFYIPRGFKVRWGSSNLLFIGGAHSPDYKYRMIGIDWWPNEEINFKQYTRASSYEIIDIIISHECPRNPFINYPKDISSSSIENLVDIYKPLYLFHGIITLSILIYLI
ncbi:metallophosphoesterase family protein [Arthrospira platensis SPKY1]|nr:metallophosphoesterase family protein [Arthrospira platensis SPKY1]